MLLFSPSIQVSIRASKSYLISVWMMMISKVGYLLLVERGKITDGKGSPFSMSMERLFLDSKKHGISPNIRNRKILTIVSYRLSCGK